LKQLERYTDNHKRGSDGACGLAKGSYAWSMFYVDGSLFRRGRFEYRLLDMPESVEVYRRNEDGVIVALYVNDVPLNEAGHCAYVGDDENEFVTWKADFARSPESVKGHPVRPEGAVEREPVELPLAEWTRVLGAGDTILDLHIPSGGGMTPEACLESMTAARDYVQSHFPDSPPKAYYCNSWIFSPQLEPIIPNSNLVDLMRRVYLFPLPSGVRYPGLGFIYAREYEDWRTAPRETSLQKGLLDLVDRNIPTQVGGMFLLLDDLGAELDHYRKGWAQTFGPAPVKEDAEERQ
ncbi:MAG: hypothetical protein ACYTGH_21170, partial [Planctomycetota bacterium]